MHVASEAVTPRQLPSALLLGRTAVSRARVIDALTGGEDNYYEHAMVAAAVASALPDNVLAARRLFVEDFEFRARVCEMLIRRASVSAFIICGADQWAPNGDPLHQRVRRAGRDAIVVYVEPEPDMARHAINAYDNPELHVYVVEDDIYDPSFLSRLFEIGPLYYMTPALVALLHCTTLPFTPSSCSRTASEIVAGLIDALPEGSFLTLSHLCAPDDPEDAGCNPRRNGVLRRRTRDIEALFCGLPLIVPHALTTRRKLVPCPEWYPTDPLRMTFAIDRFNLAGITRKGPPWPSW